MSVYEFTNNATTTLLDPIVSTDTSLTVAVGTGDLFPNPSTDQAFTVTLLDAATQIVNEIMLCTARTSDVLTVVRGQEGTTAVDWDAASIVTLLITAGTLTTFVQAEQLQTNDYKLVVGAGTANAITGTLTSNLTGATLPDGLSFTLEAFLPNTGPAYLTLTVGTIPPVSLQIVKNNQVPLVAGDIPATSYPCQMVYVAAWNKYVLLNPASLSASGILGGAANDILIQTAANVTGFVTAPVSADSYLIYNGTNISWTVSPTIATATNIAGGAQYDLLYQSAASTTAFAPAPSAAGDMLTFTGTGFAWQLGMNALNLQTPNYKMFQLDTKLVIQYSATGSAPYTTIASIDPGGNLTTTGNITGVGAP